MSEENVEIVATAFKAFTEGLEQGDSVALFTQGLAADDVEWRPVAGWPGPTSYVGQEGWAEFVDTWIGEFDAYSIQLERLVDAGGNGVVAFMHQTASGKGSGTPADWHSAAIFELENGKVARVQNYADPAEALEAAGLSE